MLKQEEKIIDGQVFIYSYSDSNFYIEGGDPKGLYIDALDLKELHREYIETDIEIPHYGSEGIIMEEI